jgi:mono/diheme cytochrome c family protein
MTMIPRFMHIVVPVTALLLLGAGHDAAKAQSDRVARGKYLVTIMSCHDCHTPGYFLGKPDMDRFLGGSDVGFKIPPGVFHGANLTPDKETGLGKWTDGEIITAIRTGKRPDGRELAPVMPYHAFAQLTDPDVKAIVAYLRTLPPVKNKVPGPFGPDEKPTGFIMTVVPGDGMPKPPDKK